MVAPNYGHIQGIDTMEVREAFNELYQQLLDKLPDQPEHKESGYTYNSFKGEFARLYKQACDAYVSALLASRGEPNSCTQASSDD